MRATHLVDKSVLARLSHPIVRERVDELTAAGLAATCGVVDLEVGYSARNAEDHQQIVRARGAMPRAPIDEDVLARALEVQGLLARDGHHRLPIPDLLIAACAERAGLAILHYDADFERIANVTGQPQQWIAPRGHL